MGKHKLFTYCFWLAAIWVILAFIVNPLGEFPLNDDWAYARPVKSLLESGKLEFTAWPAMTLIAHISWGYIFNIFTDFSFTGLRLSVLFLGAIGIIFSFLIFNKINPENRKKAFFAALVIALNPLFFSLSYTFMTDVPFLACWAAAVCFFIKALTEDKKQFIVWATFFSALAVLIRQPAVVIPLAFGFVILIKNGFSKKALAAFLPLLLVCFVLFSYEFFIKYKIGFPPEFQNKNIEFVETLSTGFGGIAAVFFRIYLKSLIYLGLFTLPIILLRLPALPVVFKKNNSLLAFLFILFASFIILYGLLKSGKVMPFGGNIIYNLGLGSPTLRDIYVFDMLEHLPRLPQSFWHFITWIGIFSGLIFLLFIGKEIINIVKSYKNKGLTNKQLWFIFALLCLVFYMPLISVISFFDRYLIPALLLVLILLFCLKTRKGKTLRIIKYISFLILGIYAYFSVALTHDYLSWNRARWEALNYLMKEEKATLKEIDGGFEFNGWYNYDAGFVADSAKSWWWVYDDKFTLSFGEMPGLKPYKSFHFQRWLPMQKDSVYILVKE